MLLTPGFYYFGLASLDDFYVNISPNVIGKRVARASELPTTRHIKI